MLDNRLRPSIRLTEDQHARLERACKQRGQLKQAFMLMAVMREVETAEAEARVAKDKRAQKKEASPSKDSGPSGLGLASRLLPQSTLRDPASSPPPVALPVMPNLVVQVGGGDSPKGGEGIAWLVSYVNTGPLSERSRRQQTAFAILRASGNQAEQDARVRQLEEALQVPTKQKPLTSAVFDTLREFLQ